MLLLVVVLLLLGVAIAGMWMLFTKAGQPGWASIVPIYNTYVLTVEIAKKEILWFILLFIPLVNIAAAVVVTLEIAKKFGKDAVYGIGLILLPFIFYPMLGFGDAKYRGGARARSSGDYDEEDDEEGRDKRNW
jgi:hypothetical protein